MLEGLGIRSERSGVSWVRVIGQGSGVKTRVKG